MDLCDGGTVRYSPFLQHTLFVPRADPESVTEAVMMSLAGLNSSCTVVVTVQDENNNPPVFSQHEVRRHMLRFTHTHTFQMQRCAHDMINNTFGK